MISKMNGVESAVIDGIEYAFFHGIGDEWNFRVKDLDSSEVIGLIRGPRAIVRVRFLSAVEEAGKIV